ncbi:hypothetical protein FEAC_10610 [Ferrimicrobium acidiphilum DSM 19497]|uniref:Helix-turn-helix domain protein n=1 Tax=Ferrimicrobium acidiphilum DSM 19497 TaxID=1121877 RepID=A0A0D8FVI0_9ACTN|nr:hypothetical protein FEAC_10610 [Ferrimicrobium acidiphilum DSM 19497]
MRGGIVGSHKGLKHHKDKDQLKQVQQGFAVREAALTLQICESTLRRLILKGSIRAVMTMAVLVQSQSEWLRTSSRGLVAVQLSLWCRRYANSGKPLSAFDQGTDSGGPSALTLGT